MKQIKLTFLLTVLMSMVGAKAFAYDIAVKNADGVTIYYNYINDGLELEVAKYPSGYKYKGNVVIPDEVTYMNRTRKVTSIGKNAFYDCRGLTSVTIPNSVTSIGEAAFYQCYGLTSVTIGNSVTSIGDYAFEYCEGLTSVTIPNSVTSIGGGAFAYCDGLTSVTIGNSVTSIGESAFYKCYGLTSVTIGNSVTNIGERAFYYCNGMEKVIVKDIAAWCNIKFGSNPLSYAHHIYSDENTEITDLVIPNSVTSIGDDAFSDCSGLTSVTIPNSVTSIGDYAFEGCDGLTSVAIPNRVTSIGRSAFAYCDGRTSVAIPNSVTSIGSEAFTYCHGLTSVTIPNSVTSIGSEAFEYCSGLTSVTIGNSVTSIGSEAFYCDNLATVISLIEKPFVIYSSVFSQNTRMNGTLYVPNGAKEAYKATDGWKDFLFMEEGNGGGGGSTPVIPEIKKCEKPTVSYRNGKLTFSSGTEGATCVSSITDADMGTYTTNEVQLGVTYNISVYAAKAGYENSETVTATLCWIDQEPKTEGITSGVASVKANAVLMQSEAGVLSIQGVDDGTPVSVYTVNGTEAGSAVSNGGQAQVNTNLQPGTVAIVKIGEKSVKVVVK